jgi:hypothetical protein
VNIERTLDYYARIGDTTTVDTAIRALCQLTKISGGDEQATGPQQERATELIEKLRNTSMTFTPVLDDMLTATELADLSDSLRSNVAGNDFAEALKQLEHAYMVCGERKLVNSDCVEQHNNRADRYIRYENSGRFAGLYRTDGTVVRIFDRDNYYSNMTAMGCAFIEDVDGRQLVVAASSWCALSIYDAADGSLVAGPFGDGDPFIGRIVTDSTRRVVAYDAWVWHPVSFLRVVTVDKLLAGDLGVSVAAAIEYLFDRPMCFMSVGNQTVLASLGADIDVETHRTLRQQAEERSIDNDDDDGDDDFGPDALLAVELFAVDGEQIATIPVLDEHGNNLYVYSGELAAMRLEADGDQLTVTVDGVVRHTISVAHSTR